MRSSGSLASVRRLNSVARAMWEMVARTDDQPGTGSATYCVAVSLRQASRTLVLAQRSYANNATTSSCMRISFGPAVARRAEPFDFFMMSNHWAKRSLGSREEASLRIQWYYERRAGRVQPVAPGGDVFHSLLEGGGSMSVI